MPLGALAVSLFAGFVLTKEDTAEELGMSPTLHTLWKVIVRYFAPIAIVVIFFTWVFGM